MARGNKTNHRGRSSKQTTESRIIHIESLLCDNFGINEIIKDNIVLKWNLSKQRLTQMIEEAWEEIHKKRIKNVNRKMDRAVAVRDKWSIRAALKGDLNTARQILNDRDKIEGILRDRVDQFVYDTTDDIKSMDPKERERIRKEIELAYGGKNDGQ
jgi:hypothetical protein